MSRFRADQILLAGSLSLVGLSAGVLILLHRPTSFLSRWLDAKVDEAVVLPARHLRAVS